MDDVTADEQDALYRINECGAITPALREAIASELRRAKASATMRPAEEIDHPRHYTQHPSGVECIEIVEHFSFNVGNVIKYAWRAGLKSADPIPDLMKARWYADREIRRLQNSREDGDR